MQTASLEAVLLFHVDHFGLYTFALKHISIIVIFYGSGIALMLVFGVSFVWFEFFWSGVIEHQS